MPDVGECKGKNLFARYSKVAPPGGPPEEKPTQHKQIQIPFFDKGNFEMKKKNSLIMMLSILAGLILCACSDS